LPDELPADEPRAPRHQDRLHVIPRASLVGPLPNRSGDAQGPLPRRRVRHPEDGLVVDRLGVEQPQLFGPKKALAARSCQTGKQLFVIWPRVAKILFPTDSREPIDVKIKS
jgi:hypothetical protein